MMGTTARAADMLVKAPPPAPAFVDWSGVYAGVHFGYGGGMKDQRFYSTDFQARGPLAGGQIGINKQIGSFVFGAEFEGSWTDINGSLKSRFGNGTSFSQDEQWRSKIDGMAAFAFRAGLASGRWLAYAKGGLAAAHQEHAYASQTVFNLQLINSPCGLTRFVTRRCSDLVPSMP